MSNNNNNRKKREIIKDTDRPNTDNVIEWLSTLVIGVNQLRSEINTTEDMTIDDIRVILSELLFGIREFFAFVLYKEVEELTNDEGGYFI